MKYVIAALTINELGLFYGTAEVLLIGSKLTVASPCFPLLFIKYISATIEDLREKM